MKKIKYNASSKISLGINIINKVIKAIPGHLFFGLALWVLFLNFYSLAFAANQSAKEIKNEEKTNVKIETKTKILILGDSLTEGYGLKKEEAYPHLLENLLQKEGRSIQIINDGISGSTSASAYGRLKTSLKFQPQILILALGANDGLRGLNPELTKKNLKKTILLAQEKNLQVLLAGMVMPSNYGKAHQDSFQQVFSSLAQELKIPLIPFLLEGVGGNKELNLDDGIHPNSKGHQIMAQTVKKHLVPLLPKN